MEPACLALFGGIVDRDLRGHSLRAATRGVSPFGDGIPARIHQTACSNINDNPQDTASGLWGDVLKGRLFLRTIQSEPYAGDLMESKLACLTQKDVTNPENTGPDT